MVERTRRLRMGLAHSSPGVSGDTARPNYMGPSGNGLVGADERGGKPAESRAFRLSRRPCPFPEGGLEVLGKTPQWSAARRAGPRYGPAVPSRWRDRSDRKTGQWVGDPARDFRRSATLYFEVAKGSKPTIWTETRRDVPRGNAPARVNTMHGGGRRC